ncbi:MAG: hypothetical protein ACIARR_13720, partial [Phycisphaerales bacterium JB059]
MQLDEFTPQIAPLPQPSAPVRFALETPFPVIGVLLILGLGAVLVLNARAKLRTGLLVLCVAALLAGALGLLAGLVETPREVLQARTRELVGALAELDEPAMRTVLHRDVAVQVRGARAFEGRDAVIRGAQTRLSGGVSIDSYAIPEVQAVIDGENAARTQARVRHAGPSVPPASWWRIDWYRASPEAPWEAIRIEPLW